MSFPPAEHGRWKMRVRIPYDGVLPGRSQLLRVPCTDPLSVRTQLLRVHTAPHKQEHPA